MTKDLIERLEAATGADRLLWPDLAQALFGETQTHPQIRLCIDALEGSLDASLVLVGEKLPGWHWGVTNTSDQPWHEAWVTPGIGKGSTGFGKNPALAVLIALLRALETK